MHPLSRREFVRLSTAGAIASRLLVEPGLLRAAAPTTQEVVDRIRKTLGVPWKADTVDTFKAGDPSAVVTGVVTTSLATIDVLRRAVKTGANMVITSGPTFYSRTDSPLPPAGRGRGAAAPPPADPVFTAKNEFIRTNNLAVWRFSDHWRLRTPDPFAQGVIDALGWAKHPTASTPTHVRVPPVALEALVAEVKASLGARGGMRVIGNPRARLQTIAVLPGTVPIQLVLTHLPQVDAILAGEIREWESSEYARDTITTGRDKALILVGRTLSEDPGMRVCAQWLEAIVPEAPVRWFPAGDPYWRPTV
jgi:putative NIF3 family GTP cyclohydrolase 1 type 2